MSLERKSSLRVDSSLPSVPLSASDRVLAQLCSALDWWEPGRLRGWTVGVAWGVSLTLLTFLLNHWLIEINVREEIIRDVPQGLRREDGFGP